MTKGMNLLVLAGLILAIILNSLFVIDEKEDGIVFQFGEAIKSDLPTGLNFKLPIIGIYDNINRNISDIIIYFAKNYQYDPIITVTNINDDIFMNNAIIYTKQLK